MLDQLLKFIQKKDLFHPSDAILLAISGGIDSVVMAHLFAQTSFNFAIAHCNFGLRGAASDEDEAFVRNLAANYEVPFYTERFETEKFAGTEKISIQMAARELRYAWFGQLLKTEGYSYLAVAHHLDDVLETIVLNLVKGTGIAGLRGIRAKNDKIIRPLLFSGKEQIRAYAEENQLPWTEDSSNSSEKYQRNLLRHQVVPVLQQINPNLLKAVESTAERVEAVEAIFYAQVSRIQQEACFICERDFYVEVEKLLKNPGLPVILDKLLEPYGFNFIQADTIAQKIAAGIVPEIIGKTFYSHTHRLDIDREHLIVSPLHRKPFGNLEIHADTESIEASGFFLTFKRKEANAFELKADKSSAALDFDRLTFPLTLRKWEPGDWFMPLGMPHKKKLSDFMIDRKIPLNLKDKVYVLTSGDDIVWVVGHRIDERFKVISDTKAVYQINMQ
jgi:tRNA(Ile)-lysidine synthase